MPIGAAAKKTMEPQCPYVAKCTEYSDAALNWFLHHKQSQEHESIDDFCVGRDKLWEGQWSSNVKEWADFNKPAQAMDQNLVQNCDSPLASDSSSSLSTWESSFFSWNSENSYTAGRCVLQSPELLSSQFLGFSLFNSGINNLEVVAKEEDSNGKLEQSTFDASLESSRPLNSEFHISELSKEGNDDGWVSDSGDSQSWVSTSSQELTRKDPLEKANDMHLGRPSHNHNTPELCERSHAYSYMETASSVSDTCGFDARHLASKAVNADALIHPNSTSSEKLCCAAPHKPCTLIFAPETYQMHLVQDFLPAAHNSEIEILNEQHVPNEHFKGHGGHGRYELPEHGENAHKSTEITQCDSARVDRKASKHLLPPFTNTVVPTALQSGDKTRPLSHTKSMHSAAVKERYASSTLHGYLRFAEQNGSPCYSFFLDDSDEVLFARVSGQERLSNKENCDWTYTFHSKKDIGKAKGAWKARPKKQRLASDLVANMKVPDVSKAKKNQYGHAKEARFVLYDGRGQQHVESATISNEKPQCQPLKPVFDNMAASQVGYQPRVRGYTVDTSANKGSCASDCASNNILKKGPCHIGNVTNASELNNSCTERLNTCINRQAELAAIVISTSVKERKMIRKESKPPLRDGAGWGVKFLDKGPESGWGLRFMEKSSSNAAGLEELHACTVPHRGGHVECIEAQTTRGACQNNAAQLPIDKDSHTRTCLDPTQKPDKRLSSRKIKVDVTVILPAGEHGLPTGDEEDGGSGGHAHGPTPLLKRWVSGGECECGGWDMGCGLSVFKAEPLSLHKRTTNVALTRHDRMNWLSPGNPFKVFTQGYKQKKVLVLEIIEAGLFSLSFQARFSPLQAFATAVALFHQQMTHK